MIRGNTGYKQNALCIAGLNTLVKFLVMMYLSSTLGRLGATVTGTDPRSTGGHPLLKEKKETPNEQVSVRN